MVEKSLLVTGLCGTCFSGICCVTPLAVIGLTSLGLSAWVGWLDYILIPAFVCFAALTVYAFWRRRRA
jgi:mercuric ion transport protein